MNMGGGGGGTYPSSTILKNVQYYYFSVFSFSAKQVEVLKQKYHIYMLKNGRICICHLTATNIDYVANGIDDVVRNVKDC